jgi:K+-sensing histidine kinase KdpD
MLKKYSFVFVVFLAMLIQSFAASSSLYSYALFVPVLSLAVLMVVLTQDQGLIRLCFVFYLLFGAVWMFIQSQEPSFGRIFMTMVGTAVCFFVFEHRWNKKVVLAETRRKLMAIATSQIENQVKEKDGELKKLEKHVSEIIELFEAAKSLNVALDYNDLAQGLKDKVLSRFDFRSTELLIIGDTQTEAEDWIYYSFPNGTDENDKKKKQPALTALIELCKMRRTTLKIENDSENSAKHISIENYPCWIFPLYVEDLLLGALKVEKPHDRDLQKFSILATQIALQVKKIKLYETVKQLSITDGLTKTFVRRYFLDRFVEEIKRFVISSKEMTSRNISKVYIFGEGSAFAGLDVKLAESLAIPVEMTNLESSFKKNSVVEYFAHDWNILLPAVGACLQ